MTDLLAEHSPGYVAGFMELNGAPPIVNRRKPPLPFARRSSRVRAGSRDDAPPTQLPLGCGAFDLVLMNPPFGTQKGSNGVDMRFLRVGLAMCAADGAVYSLNKTSTRSFIAKTAASWGARQPRSHTRDTAATSNTALALLRCCVLRGAC